MSTSIAIRKIPGPHVIRAGGAVLGESSNVLEVNESGQAPVLYFPRSDIAMAFLDASDSRSTCPTKGEAVYFSIVTKSTTIADAVWSYETPNQDAERIAGYLAFAKRDDVAIEAL